MDDNNNENKGEIKRDLIVVVTRQIFPLHDN